MFGAPLETGNLGVSALGASTLAALRDQDPSAEFTVFDYLPGTGGETLKLPDGEITFERRGAYRSRRWHRPENLRTMYLCARVAPGVHPNVRAIDRCTDVFDISGGDSFTDLYGPKRFTLVTLPKRIALARDRPLHLLPQTYGPFGYRSNRQLAAQIVSGATTAWARDPQSFERLQELLGERFDPRRHRSGVDVAFLLPAATGPETSVAPLGHQDQRPTVGVNVSGLLANHPADASARFGLACDYFAATETLIRRLLRETAATVILVPHVRGREIESDEIASAMMMDRLADTRGRVSTAPPGLDAMQSKGLIASVDWFVGARMHSTIAALSSKVAVSAVAYSDKTVGVFETCGVAEQVHDARTLSTADLADALWDSWQDRTRVAEVLDERIPAVIARARSQFSEMLHSELDPATRSR